MSDWEPASDANVAVRRSVMLARARAYFADNGVLAVDTPSLSSSAPTDRHIDSLSLKESGLFLQTSPEFHMKRLLAAGYPDIYSICRVYRGGEKGRTHLPEFTMIEWYRHSMTLNAIVQDALNLIASVLDRPDLPGSVMRHEYADAFVNGLGLDPAAASLDELASAAGADASLRDAIAEDRDAWLDLIMATRIATEFRDDALTVVQHYPASQAALARICPADSMVADRFEIYFGTLELANGYVELTDAEEQLRRMNKDLDARREQNRPDVPRDEQLIEALRSGLPDCAGVALGFERLHMVDAGDDDIRNVVSFT